MATNNHHDLYSLVDEIRTLKNNSLIRIKNIEEKEKLLNEYGNEIESNSLGNNVINDNEDDVIILNIGGKIFYTTCKTLFSASDSLFSSKLIMNHINNQLKTTTPKDYHLFLDRNPKYFTHILFYLRNKSLDFLSEIPHQEIQSLLQEAKYYSLTQLVSILQDSLDNVKYINIEIHQNDTNEYHNDGIDSLNNFNDKRMQKGICVGYNGHIIFTLERIVQFNQLEMGSYKGNPIKFNCQNGSMSSIFTSLNKIDWFYIGTIPNDFIYCPTIVDVEKSRCKYLKIANGNPIGIGYCRIVL